MELDIDEKLTDGSPAAKAAAAAATVVPLELHTFKLWCADDALSAPMNGLELHTGKLCNNEAL